MTTKKASLWRLWDNKNTYFFYQMEFYFHYAILTMTSFYYLTTRILQGFALLSKLGFLLFKLLWGYQN